MSGNTAQLQAWIEANVIWTIPDPVPDEVYESIAAQVVAGTPSVDYAAAAMIPYLKSWHLLYWHNAPSGIPQVVNGQITNWGDCGQPTNSIPAGGLKALSDVSTGLTAAVGASASTVAALGGGTAAAAAGLGALNAVPIVGTIAAIALLPLELIFAHHAAAVSKEQGTLCAWDQTFNQWLDAVDQAVQSGAMLPADGVAALQSMEAQYNAGVEGVSAACTPGNTNAACDEKGFVRALVLLRTWIYNNLPQFQSGGNPISALLGGSGASGSASTGGGSMILIFLLIAAALFL